MKYAVIFWTSLKEKVMYRTDLWLQYILLGLQLVVNISVWQALYTNDALMLKGYSLKQLSLYLLSTNLLALLFSVAPAFRLADQIKSGRLSTLLLRPVSLYGESLVHFLGAQVPSLLLKLGVIGYLLWTLELSLWRLLWLLVYLALALLMFYGLMLLFGMLAFWLLELWPLRAFVTACYLMLGGRYFPLSSLPEAIFRFLQYNPFSLVTDVPARIMTGQLALERSSNYFLAVLGWIMLLTMIYKFTFLRGTKRYEGVES